MNTRIPFQYFNNGLFRRLLVFFTRIRFFHDTIVLRDDIMGS